VTSITANPWATRGLGDVVQTPTHFAGLLEFANEPAGTLSFGIQRRIEFARAHATEPRILLLDEPAAGLNITETSALSKLISRIREWGATILVVEHDMSLVMGISDRVVVLNQGEKLTEGTPREVQRDPRVIQTYLGEADAPDS
jgi:ABC-type branched-subunit amino acid transport system ATPase component